MNSTRLEAGRKMWATIRRIILNTAWIFVAMPLGLFFVLGYRNSWWGTATGALLFAVGALLNLLW